MSDPLDVLLDEPLPLQAEDFITLPSLLNVMINGKTDELSLKLDLFLALKQARYLPVSLRDVAQLVHGEYEDDQLTALLDAFHQFSQADSMPPAKKIKPGTIVMHHLMLGAITIRFEDLCKKYFTLTELENMVPNQEMSWDEYVRKYACRKLMQK